MDKTEFTEIKYLLKALPKADDVEKV